MKYTRYLIVTSILIIFSLIYPTAEAAVVDIKDINDKLVVDLQSHFNEAKAPTEEILSSKKAWTCELYGMRSRLQTTKKPNFYQFTVKSSVISNNGSQVIREYHPTASGLKGSVGPLYEEVRFDSKGRLIGEMSLNNEGRNLSSERKSSSQKKVASLANVGQEVIAYSVCK